jgi:hypothetical protein
MGSEREALKSGFRLLDSPGGRGMNRSLTTVQAGRKQTAGRLTAKVYTNSLLRSVLISVSLSTSISIRTFRT